MVRMAQIKRVELLSEVFPSISRSLNQASDSLNANIIQLEEALNKLRLGVRVEIVLNSELVESEDEPLTYVESLEYAKHNGRWGLWLAEYYEESVDAKDPNSYKVTPLKDATRELRFLAVDQIPELLQQLAIKGKEFAEEAARKSERVAQVVATIKTSDLLNI